MVPVERVGVSQQRDKNDDVQLRAVNQSRLATRQRHFR